MNKIYGIVADGSTSELRKTLKKDFKDINTHILDDYVCVNIPVSEKTTYLKVKDLFEEYAQRYQFGYDLAFRADDFLLEDYEKSDAVGVMFPTVGGQSSDDRYRWVKSNNNGFSHLKECECCGHKVIIWDGQGNLEIASKKPFSLPFFIATPFDVAIMRVDVLNRIKEAGLLTRVHVKGCKVLTEETIRNHYFAIYPEIDLGEPTGNIEFTNPCSGCGQRNLQSVGEFLIPFDKKSFNKANISRSSWSVAGNLFVSNEVYIILRDYLKETKEEHDQTFTLHQMI